MRISTLVRLAEDSTIAGYHKAKPATARGVNASRCALSSLLAKAATKVAPKAQRTTTTSLVLR